MLRVKRVADNAPIFNCGSNLGIAKNSQPGLLSCAISVAEADN